MGLNENKMYYWNNLFSNATNLLGKNWTVSDTAVKAGKNNKSLNYKFQNNYHYPRSVSGSLMYYFL